MKYREESRGKCISCGFLAIHATGPVRAGTPSYYEVEKSQRESGQVWVQGRVEPSTGPIVTEPVCFRHAAAIREDIKEITDNDALLNEAAKRVFNKDRNCQAWYPYGPGLTAKEHLEEMTRELVEKSRRDFELKLFEISKKIQEDSRKIASRSFWFNCFFTVVLVFLTCVQIWLALGENRRLLEQLFKLLIHKFS